MSDTVLSVPEVTHRRVLKIALPIVLSNATVPILGTVDTAVVGQMGLAAPIGAVGIGAIILTATYWMFGFLRMGTTGLTSQAQGAGQTGEVAALLTRVLLIAAVAGLGIIALQSVIFWGAFIVSPASAEVETLARDYMQIRVYSAPAAIGMYGVTGWLIAQERTRAVLVIQLWTNGLNIVLDLWFVLGLDMGVSGVAMATLTAEWTGVALGLWFCRGAFQVPAWRDWSRVFDGAKLAHMMSVNTDIMLRSLLLQAIFLSFLLMGANFGDETLAANQVLLQFLYITAYALDGFALGAESLVGQAMGARDRAALRRGALLSSLWGTGVSLGLAAVFALAGGQIIDLMTTSEPVRAAARGFLIYMVFAPLAGSASWMLDGIFIGATRARDMRNMMAVSFVIYVVALAALVPFLGNHGLWLALLLSFVARGVTLGLRYPALEAEADRPAA
ncbi:MATE family efflux transporter [Thalassovita sp.]|uniref:MATE family efflux transporter n=1 Tax=Thalassovita sp. TaxID=1979401 RepID=UPI002881FCF1|nr:MATE family efflux transporter [Thalassovita sp.]MDF1803452.1 MATE family efflux transporter [Thalassovita sp.]